MVEIGKDIAAVTPADVERFKKEKAAEREFCWKLQMLVKELEAAVGPNNAVWRSQTRFLRRMIGG